MYKVNEDVKKRVYEAFGRNEEMVEDDVNIIKSWMQTQPHLPETMEDVKIRNFLNLNKFSIEKTKEKIDMYYTIRSVIPDVFEVNNLKCEKLENLFKDTYFFTFPKAVNGAHCVYFVKPKTPDTVNLLEVINVWFAIFEIRLSEDFMVDDIVIVDFENFSLSDIKQCTPTIVSKFFAVYKKVYALRLKKLIYVNCPSFTSVLVSVLKAVMKPKIFTRLELHEDAAVLKDFFPQDELPRDYGGEGPSLDQLNGNMKKKLFEYENRLQHVYKLRVNETLRPQKLNNDEILGFYGSFKKINVD
ncbi:hypothetical protein Zmor_022139 [Zophobas morio]|uniref:CRAL-TRIO domain-containing protein n=1 Tax=Zophobas morio TaxID=2755281 RepID=A0AA38M538_9CUCU|nr:hypothetical protein Zmor_022139 [Zophobas morio]